MELFSLTDKIALVTGACGLLGIQHCKALAEAGARVVAADLDENACQALVNELGTEHLAISLDVTSQASLWTARDRILEKYGRLDVLVNNAAINDMFENPLMAKEQSMFEHYPLEQWNRSWNVNVSGMFLCSQVMGAVMAAQGSGSIINIASTYGIVAPDQSIYRNAAGEQTFYKSPAYPVTKAAVLGFTRYLAAYWGNRNVRVNALSPGGVENNQDTFFIQNYAAKTLLGKMAAAADYKGAVVFLASNASAYMTGANLVVDGGWTAI
ncbi:SDR family oxidoreductase [Chitinophaga agrisoli]|uniref:SDR family oxidoreductase n=1 Tax=Chitinophaga agrisoli TaxID=2607653 RepID=A0A5B2VZ63_9BACT|nr:SDR family oxidoreductase [Chitinophaga agrisoli]KAA2243536.1 SDR family oxidoreductase [Chitinophaga agrisoli]